MSDMFFFAGLLSFSMIIYMIVSYMGSLLQAEQIINAKLRIALYAEKTANAKLRIELDAEKTANAKLKEGAIS